MAMSLTEWHQAVSKHLQFIEAGAEMCSRHVHYLVGLPDWPTRADFDLDYAEKVLVAALGTINKAREDMREKPHVS